MRTLFVRLLLAATAVASPIALHAASTNTGADPSGIYTYTISLPNGASFYLQENGSLTPSSTAANWSYIGSPATGYVAPGNMEFINEGGNGLTELQIQFNLPDATNPDTADSVDSFTFLEPDSFWATTGTNQVFPDQGDTISGLLFVTETVSGNPTNGDASYINGTVTQGAYYNFYSTPGGVYTAPGQDPACCSITTTYTPASMTPEPGTATLLSTGGAAILGVYRRRRRLA